MTDKFEITAKRLLKTPEAQKSKSAWEQDMVKEDKSRRDFAQCCSEILEWHKTGVLTGDALRNRAKSLDPNFGDMGQRLSIAELQVKKEALQFVLDHQPAALIEKE